jgi:menaquinone-dependent protoporphyrinogen IX oxidase
LKPVEERAEKTVPVSRARKKGSDDKILKYHLKPISIGLFGGILDYNKMSFLARKAMEVGYKAQLQKVGFKEGQFGVYDLRDWNEIGSCAKELAKEFVE